MITDHLKIYSVQKMYFLFSLQCTKRSNESTYARSFKADTKLKPNTHVTYILQ